MNKTKLQGHHGHSVPRATAGVVGDVRSNFTLGFSEVQTRDKLWDECAPDGDEQD